MAAATSGESLPELYSILASIAGSAAAPLDTCWTPSVEAGERIGQEWTDASSLDFSKACAVTFISGRGLEFRA